MPEIPTSWMAGEPDDIDDIVAEMRELSDDHEPAGWPAVRMSQITALCDEIDRLRRASADAEWDIRGELAAALKCWHRLTGEEAAELVASGAALKEEVDQLRLAEEGAKEAFGHVVQQKRDLEAEVKRLRELLASAYKMVPQQRHAA